MATVKFLFFMFNKMRADRLTMAKKSSESHSKQVFHRRILN